MTSIHDQAMQYIYQQVLQRLLDHMSQAQRASVQLLIQRLMVAAGGVEYIADFRLLVLHAGDARSAGLLAVLRAAQLSIALRGTDTFRLRVVVGSQPNLRDEVLRLHERAFSALFLQDDPRVQLLMLNGDQVVPFRAHGREAGNGSPRDREALLLFGHLTGGRPEALLGSRLQLQMADAIGQVLALPEPASALVTALPATLRRRYLAWSRASLRAAGEGAVNGAQHCLDALSGSLARLHLQACAPLQRRELPDQGEGARPQLRLIVVDDLLHPGSEGMRLAQMLGCAEHSAGAGNALSAFIDPVPLAYLQGLQSQDGMAISQSWREQAKVLFQQGYGVGDTQLICLLDTPFIERGRNLERFVKVHHPSMRVALPYLHQALQGRPCPDAVMKWLIDTSGLNLAQLRALYCGRVDTQAARLLAALARRDADLRLLAPRRAMAQTQARALI